jgi:Zinc-finger of C2H2 type
MLFHCAIAILVSWGHCYVFVCLEHSWVKVSSRLLRQHENDLRCSPAVENQMPGGETTPITMALTAAELIRQKQQHKNAQYDGEQDVDAPKVDLDDEIRRLEAELQEIDDDDEDSGSENEQEEEEDNDTVVVTKEAILALSSVKDDRIERLPAAALPAPVPKKSTKNKKRPNLDETTGKSSSSKRNKKTSTTTPNTQNTVSQGLKNAVQEVLRGYIPRSAEHLPFYCRCCARQYDDLAAFQLHKTTDFHIAAVDLERKASYCKLCRKQLTSPAQLSDHLQSRPHHERLRTLQARQPAAVQQQRQQQHKPQQHSRPRQR